MFQVILAYLNTMCNSCSHSGKKTRKTFLCGVWDKQDMWQVQRHHLLAGLTFLKV